MGIDGIAGGGMRALQAWQAMREVQQAAAIEQDPRQFQELVDVAASDLGGPGGMTGLDALEYARRLEELQKEVETIANVSAMEQAGMSQHNLVNLELQQLPAMRRDENQIPPRDLRSMLDGL